MFQRECGSCWTAVSQFETTLSPQISANNDVYGEDRSHVRRTSSCLHTMDETSSKMTGFCSLNVLNKISDAFFFYLSDRVTDLQMVLFPDCLFADWWRCDTLQQHKPFISPIQKKYKSRIVPHSFCCRFVTIKHPQVGALCGFLFLFFLYFCWGISISFQGITSWATSAADWDRYRDFIKGARLRFNVSVKKKKNNM